MLHYSRLRCTLPFILQGDKEALTISSTARGFSPAKHSCAAVAILLSKAFRLQHCPLLLSLQIERLGSDGKKMEKALKSAAS